MCDVKRVCITPNSGIRLTSSWTTYFVQSGIARMFASSAHSDDAMRQGWHRTGQMAGDLPSLHSAYMLHPIAVLAGADAHASWI